MEIKINKEIQDYSETIFFGLSMRQFFFSTIACIVAIILFFSLKEYLDIEILSWICILGAIPFCLLGFVKYNGMYAEEFLLVWIKSEILFPKILLFKAENLYYELLRDTYLQIKKNELKNKE